MPLRMPKNFWARGAVRFSRLKEVTIERRRQRAAVQVNPRIAEEAMSETSTELFIHSHEVKD